MSGYRICTGCNQVIQGRCDCQRAKRNTAQKRKYNNKRWRAVRRKVMARDKGICQVCGELGNEVDHIKPARDALDQFYALDNLQLLCKPCHSRKTIHGA